MSPDKAGASFYVYLFLAASLAFGTFFLYATPPFHGADERNHVARAYAISTGEFTPATEGDRRGGMVPLSLTRLQLGFWGMRFDASAKTTADSIARFRSVSLEPELTVFRDYPNTAVYPWPVYVPAAVGLATARAFGCSVLNTFRAARWAGLLFWLLCGTLAIWLLPAWRGLFTALLLLPMTVWTHATVTADTVTNGIAVITIAYLLHLAFAKNKRVGKRELGILLVVTLLAASTKLVYTPLLLLALLIPTHRFTARGGKWQVAVLTGGLALALLFYWSAKSDRIYLPYAEYAQEFRDVDIPLAREANVRIHKEMVIAAPYRLFRAAGNSLMETWWFYAYAYIGVLGWLDTWLPWWTYWVAYFYLFFLAFTERTVKWSARLTFALALILCYLLVILSQLLSWEPVGAHTVGAAQGRYLIPFAPLLFLMVVGKKWDGPWRRILVSSASIGLLGIAAWAVLNRYFVM